MATAKKSSSHRTKSVNYKTFKVCKDVKPFVQFNITYQTLYWATLVIVILILALWILQIQINISDVFNQITPA